jgi:hypothetical protein
MQLSETNQASIRAYIDKNSDLRNSIRNKSEAKDFLFAVNTAYAYLLDLFGHLDNLVNLDRKSENFTKDAYEETYKAFASVFKAQYYLQSPLNYYNNEALIPHTDNYYQRVDQASGLIKDFLQDLAPKFLIPALSQDERLGVAIMQHGFTKIYSFDNIAERKPKGFSMGAKFRVEDTNKKELFHYNDSMFGPIIKGPLAKQVPEHLLAEMKYFFTSSFANLIDNDIASRLRDQFPESGKISFGYDFSNQILGLTTIDGDKILESYFKEFPESKTALKAGLGKLFQKFFESKILPYLDKEDINIGFVGAGFSFEGSQEEKARLN